MASYIKKIILCAVVVCIIYIVYITYKQTDAKKAILPIVTVQPTVIYPGDPIMVTINASSSVSLITFDSKKVSTFIYDDKPHAFIPIPLEEKNLNHKLLVQLSNGMTFQRNILLKERVKIEKPLGIPEKLGGNTPEAGKALINNLAQENYVINNIKTATSTLWSKSFIAPLSTTTVTDAYGYNRDTAGYSITHKGTDLHAATGTPVYAMNAGTVRLARTFIVYGNTIIIDHGLGVQTLYMHLSKLEVKEGDTVKVGQEIGLSGMTGYAEAPHLHISIKINGISIDPMKFLAFFGIL